MEKGEWVVERQTEIGRQKNGETDWGGALGRVERRGAQHMAGKGRRLLL